MIFTFTHIAIVRSNGGIQLYYGWPQTFPGEFPPHEIARYVVGHAVCSVQYVVSEVWLFLQLN